MGLISCNDILNQQPKTSISPQKFFNSQKELLNATNDIYRQMGIVYDANGIVDIGAEQRSDNVQIIQTAGTKAGYRKIAKNEETAGNEVILDAWNDAYKAIYVCNNVIDKIKNSNVTFDDPSLKKGLIAEATTVRSLIFFDLVRDFGAIPLPLKPLTIEEGFQKSRMSVDKVYKQLIDDLETAKEDLPKNYTGDDVGRITKYGAAAILAKVYLRNGDVTEAKKELKEIIDSGVYSLDANDDGNVNKQDYNYLFQPDTKNSKSSIVEVQYKSGSNGFNSNHEANYRPFSHQFHFRGVDETIQSGNGGENTPSENLINEFENKNGVRRKISAALGFHTLDTDEFISWPHTLKFYDPEWKHPGQNVEIIRYADILLLYAEITHDPHYLNKVRERVGLAGYGTPEYSSNKYNTLDKAIQHERRLALCFEFHRFYDLTRKGIAIKVLNKRGYNNINKNKLLLPIPQHVIDVNPNIKQNPGY
jgi:hypothetical protein